MMPGLKKNDNLVITYVLHKWQHLSLGLGNIELLRLLNFIKAINLFRFFMFIYFESTLKYYTPSLT